ncbi:hypothetical protein CPB84DRAFT_1760528 [Gymnopilus junonius]|uniref:Uncharacterized protein n=1 Tax=Gymnopilus junonius TaxID=109634 RepID=A0A9P5P291_GYMJU|nr:hypothetical protein CPB84DRAFT_1760528 [Gymnopilus junonius]
MKKFSSAVLTRTYVRWTLILGFRRLSGPAPSGHLFCQRLLFLLVLTSFRCSICLSNGDKITSACSGRGIGIPLSLISSLLLEKSARLPHCTCQGHVTSLKSSLVYARENFHRPRFFIPRSRVSTFDGIEFLPQLAWDKIYYGSIASVNILFISP